MALKAIIFDHDGVIAEAELGRLRHLKMLADKKGYRGIDEKLHLKHLVGKQSTEFLKTVFGERISSKVIDEIAEQRRKEYSETPGKFMKEVKGIKDVCNKLSGRYDLAVASTNSKRVVEATLNHLNLLRYFKVVMTRDDIERVKPSPEIYLKTLKALERKKDECLAVEDSETGIDAAKKAGIKVVALRNRFYEECGYIPDISQADIVIDNLNGLLAIAGMDEKMKTDMVSEIILKQQLKSTLDKTDFDFGKGVEKYVGKVRDNYILPDKRIMITTDRISAFDVVLTTLPFKGQVLNQMSQFWFEKTKNTVKNAVIDVPDPNVTVAKNCKPIMVEFVVRGYITGVTTTSIWHNYEKGGRDFCGHKLPEGLKKDQKLPHTLLTPSTKAEKGQHDESVSRTEVIKRGLMTAEEFDKVAEMSMKVFELGRKIAAKQGIILVDTKYEFGYDEKGDIMLIDEVHTPDSSRFWFEDTYEELFRAGKEQRKIDKEYVRKWLSDKGFMGEGPVPEIPDEIRVEAARRYIEAYELITGQEFKAVAGNPLARIRENLIKKGYLRG